VISGPFYQNRYQIGCPDAFLAYSLFRIDSEIENTCVGGLIPPWATKNRNSPLVGLFSFLAWLPHLQQNDSKQNQCGADPANWNIGVSKN
jgi:hypothetical protein